MSRPRHHRRTWKMAEDAGALACFWCRLPFNTERPPTRDHITPRSDGGTYGDVVFACVPCNRARANCEFQAYVEAVVAEHLGSARAARPYVPPKWDSNGQRFKRVAKPVVVAA